MRAALVLGALAVARAGAAPREVTLDHEITWVDTLPPSYKLAGAEFLAHGWDVITDMPLPTPVWQFHYGGLVDPQSDAPDGVKTMEMMGTNDVFFIPDECEAKPHGNCEFSATSEVYTSSTKYARSLAVSAGVSADVAALGAFSASASVNSASEGMQGGEKDMFMLKAECLASGIELVRPTSFHKSFASAFAELPDQFGPEDSDSQWKVYRKFFDTFGTHVITKADLGGLLQQTTFVSKSTVASKSSSSIAASLEASLNAGFGSASASVGGSYGKEDSSESASSSMESKVTTYGGQPGSTGDGSGAAWGAWAATVPTHPVPVHRRMASLGDMLGYKPEGNTAEGPAAEALCKASGVEQGSCFKRIASVYHGMRRYIKERAKGQSTTYAVYVHFADAAEEQGGPMDPANEQPVPADLPASVRESLPAGALDRMNDEVKVCSFECQRPRMIVSSQACEPGMPPVRVLESQAKGCASLKEGTSKDFPEVASICQARNSACTSSSAKLLAVEAMTALKAAGVVDATPSTSSVGGTSMTSSTHAASAALASQLVSATVCQINCLADDPLTGRAKPCMDGSGNARIAFVPESSLPKCHTNTKQNGLTSSSPVIGAPEHCGGCGVPNKGRFMGSFKGDPKNIQAAIAELRAISQLPANQRSASCEFECGSCPSNTPTLVSFSSSQVKGCPNYSPSSTYSDAPVVGKCKEFGCTASKATFLRSTPVRLNAPVSGPVPTCTYACSCGQTVTLVSGTDVPACEKLKPGAEVSSEAVVAACSLQPGCTEVLPKAKFQQASVIDGGMPRFAARSVELTGFARPMIVQSNSVQRTPRRLAGSVVTMAEATAAVPASLRGLPMEEVAFVETEASTEADEDTLPVISIFGELGEVMEWHLGDNKPEAVAMGTLAKFERTFPGVGLVSHIDLTLPAGLSIRMLRVTDVDAGVEYIFKAEGAGPFQRITPVLMDEADGTVAAGVAIADVPVTQEQAPPSTTLQTASDEAPDNEGESPSMPEAMLVEVSEFASLPLTVVPAMSALYGKMGERRSFNHYDIFIASSAAQFIQESGDVVLTLTGDSGSVSIPVSVYQERYWQLLGTREQIEDSDLPNALYVKSRSTSFRNFKKAGDKDKQRVGFFSYEGNGVGTLRRVQVQVRKAVRPAVVQIKDASYDIQRKAAAQICSALLGSNAGSRPTDDCTTLTGENPSLSKWPNMAFIMRDLGVVGLGAQQCETVKNILQRGNEQFQCWFENGKKWFRYAQTPDYSRSAKKQKKLVGAGFSDSCEGHGKRDVCARFFSQNKGYFSGSEAELDLSNMRFVHVQEVKVVDYRSRRTYLAQFDTTVNEFAAATRDLL